MDVKKKLEACLERMIKLLQNHQGEYVDLAETVHDFLKSPTVVSLHDFLISNSILMTSLKFQSTFYNISSDFFQLLYLHQRRVLKNIANPMEYLKKEAEADGNLLDVKMAIEISNDSNWLKKLAEDGLRVI